MEVQEKLRLKRREVIPTGKTNHQGQLVTSSQDITNLLTTEFIERRRPRPNYPDFENIDVIKKDSFKVKLEKPNNN